MVETGRSSYRTILISGAAGGLGSILVKKFSEQGDHVIALDISAEGLENLSNTDNVTTKVLDITSAIQVSDFIKEIDLDHKGLDILICLAGIYDTYPVTEANPDFFKKIMAVNLLGTAILVQGFLKPLIKNKGRVIVVSSESYKIQAMFQPYMISKASLEAYCRVARQELALKGVKLAVIRPGAIRTPLLNWMESSVNPLDYPVFSREFIKSRNRSVKMVGRIATPGQVAGKILTSATVSNPKRIYRINNNPLLTLISLMPANIFDWLVLRIMK